MFCNPIFVLSVKTSISRCLHTDIATYLGLRRLWCKKFPFIWYWPFYLSDWISPFRGS